jgi:hypothetical protein
MVEEAACLMAARKQGEKERKGEGTNILGKTISPVTKPLPSRLLFLKVPPAPKAPSAWNQTFNI